MNEKFSIHSLTSAELLSVWEKGLSQTPTTRALILLSAACENVSLDDLAGLSIGQRDAWLLTIRERIFGSDVQSIVSCHQCGEKLEIGFRTSDLGVSQARLIPETLTVLDDDYEVRFHLPNSFDLGRISAEADIVVNRGILLECCVSFSRYRGQDISPKELPESVVRKISARMASSDQQADIQRILLTCSACGHQWYEKFNILTFFWEEIHAWAIRLFREIHSLASAYGWSETEILSLNPLHRQMYLEMVGT